MKTRTENFDHPKQIGDSFYNNPNHIVEQFEKTAPNYRVN
jgi:hypothetical protein